MQPAAESESGLNWYKPTDGIHGHCVMKRSRKNRRNQVCKEGRSPEASTPIKQDDNQDDKHRHLDRDEEWVEWEWRKPHRSRAGKGSTAASMRRRVMVKTPHDVVRGVEPGKYIIRLHGWMCLYNRV